FEPLPERVGLCDKSFGLVGNSDQTRQVGCRSFGVVDVSLNLAECDWSACGCAIRVKHGIMRILPALVHESVGGLPVVSDKAGSCRIAVVIDPVQCALDVRPDRRDELKIAGS